jgi:hypothetical protein
MPDAGWLREHFEWVALGVAAVIGGIGRLFVGGGSAKIVEAIAALEQTLREESTATRKALHDRMSVLEGKIDSVALEDQRRETRFVDRLNQR